LRSSLHSFQHVLILSALIALVALAALPLASPSLLLSPPPALFAQTTPPTTPPTTPVAPTDQVVFDSKPITESYVGLAYSYRPIVRSLVPSLVAPTVWLHRGPAGMTMKEGVLVWTPSATGTSTVTVRTSLGGTTASVFTEQTYTLVTLDRSAVPPITFPPTTPPTTRPPVPLPQPISSFRFVTAPPAQTFVGIEFYYQAVAVSYLYGSSDSRSDVSLPYLPVGRQNVLYTLDKAPGGMTIESTTGIVRWTPPLTISATSVDVSIKATAQAVASSTGANSTAASLSAVQNFTLQLIPLDSARIAFVSRPSGLQAITGLEFSYGAIAGYGTAAMLRGVASVGSIGELVTSLTDALGNVSVNTNTNTNVNTNANADASTLLPFFPLVPQSGQNVIRYEIVSGAPAGMTMNSSTGTIRWTPALTTPASTLTLTLRASLLARPSISTTQTLTIRVTPREQLAVQFVSSPSRTAFVGREYAYDASAFYNLFLFGVNPYPIVIAMNGAITRVPAPQSLTYSLVSPPVGMTIIATNGTIRWTPRDTSSAVSVTVRAVVSTNASLSTTQTFSIRVSQPPVASLVFLGQGAPSAETGQEYVYRSTARVVSTVSSSVNGGLSVRYAIESGPAGIVVDSLTGIVRWTPRDTGTVSITLRARAFSGPNVVATATQMFSVRVVAGPCVTLSGRVRYADGSAVLNGVMTVSSVPSSAVPSNVTSVSSVSTQISNGSYRLQLRAGTYALRVTGSDFVEQTIASLSVACGAAITRDFSVERRAATRYFLASGRVSRKKDGTAVARAQVVFLGSSPSTGVLTPAARAFSATTDENGFYTQALPDNVSFVAFASAAIERTLATTYYNGTPDGTTLETRATQIRFTADQTINFIMPDRTSTAKSSVNAGGETSGETASGGTASGETASGGTASQTAAQVLQSVAALTVTPNPAQNLVSVALPAQTASAAASRLVVTNALGVTVFTTDVSAADLAANQSLTLDASTWAQGVYVVRLYDGQRAAYSARIMIAR
jgi:hypothetical protein